MNKGHKPHSLESLPYFSRVSSEIMHYTCNSPPADVLKRNSIRPAGGDFNCINPNEVLIIPLSIYNKYGFHETSDREVLRLNLEKLMKNLK